MSIKLSNIKYYNSNKNLKNIDESIYYNILVNNNFYNHNSFKLLFENFDINKLKKINIIFNYKLKKFIVTDGLKSLSIMIFKKIINNFIPLKYLNITYDEESISKIKISLKLTTDNKNYNYWSNNSNHSTHGYHSFVIGNIFIKGQRIPHIRLNKIKTYINFNNKNVLDLGCNTGGMLLHLPEIKNGYGIDFCNKCINSANIIKNILNYNNLLNFYCNDLNTFELNNLFHNINIDIIFLLSIGSWVKNWKNLYKDCYHKSKIIILETNNDQEGIEQIELFQNLNASIKLIINKSIDDTTNNVGRKTYLIKNNNL